MGVVQSGVTCVAGLTPPGLPMPPSFFEAGATMDRSVAAAARLPESDRKELAVQALARSATVSDLATRHGVSRKFVYAQKRKASIALDDAFLSAAAEDEVLFELVVTKAWLCQVIVALALIAAARIAASSSSCVTCSAYPSASAPFTT